MVRSRAITDLTELTGIRRSALIVGKEDEAVRLAGIPPVDLFALPPGASGPPRGSGVMSACLPGRPCHVLDDRIDLGEKTSPEEAF